MPYTRKVLIFKGTRGKQAGSPSSVGEHVLKKRLEDGLTRRQRAARIGVDESTVMNWELGRTRAVPVKAMPGIIAYLQYNPEPRPDDVGGQLRWKRRALGWSSRHAARMNSVDPGTWSEWDKRDSWPRYPRYQRLLEEFLQVVPGEAVPGEARREGPESQATTAARQCTNGPDGQSGMEGSTNR